MSSSPQVPRYSKILVASAVVVLVLGRGLATAQPGNYQWWPLDGAPPGTPPTIVLQPTSNLQQTVLDVTIHGFYYESIVQMNQTFRRISLNKTRTEAAYRMVGRPELPALHHLMGDLVGTTVGLPAVQVVDEIQIPGALIYPYQPPAMEGGQPIPFQWDQGFYQQTSQPYPPTRGTGLGYRGRFNRLDLVAAETYPFRVAPATQTLFVTRRFIVTIAHPGGNPPTTLAITRRQGRQYDLTLANNTVVSPYRPVTIVGYAGDFLFVTDPAFVEEIDPLVDQKQRRGYAVTVATTDETGTTIEEIKDYIADWWALGDPSRDHYVLLVGDTPSIPLGVAEGGVNNASDLVYACIDGLGADGLPDVYPEVRLGRFSCDTEAECTEMVTKTLTYEEGYPGSGWWLGDVLLTCHEDTGDPANPDQYMEAQEAVRTYPYSIGEIPVFFTLYGQDGATDADVDAAIEAGKGLVCYRGHGSTASWIGWNGGDYDTGDVGLLANDTKTPVLLAIACLNNNIAIADCIGEEWMETTERAVAHFGATGCSDRSANDLLDLELFETIYEDDFTIISEAIAGANVATIISEPGAGESNAWQYLLLGDPELKVWTGPTTPIVISSDLTEIFPGPETLTIDVNGLGLDPTPVPFAIVAVFKDGEVADNRYTDAQGTAEIPIDPKTPGIIEIVAYTEFGTEGVARDTVVVLDPATGVRGSDVALTLDLAPAQPNPFHHMTAVSYTLPTAGHVRLRVLDVTGRLVATLVDEPTGAGRHVTSWDGMGQTGGPVAAGVYFTRLEFGSAVRTGRVSLVR